MAYFALHMVGLPIHPLGREPARRLAFYLNLMTVMLLGGLWHGASWNFVIWGAIHGSMLAFERMQGKKSAYALLPAAVRVDNNVPDRMHQLGLLPCGNARPRLALSEVPIWHGRAYGSRAIWSAGVIYTPYHAAMFLACAVVVWTMPQVWNFTQRLKPGKIGAVPCNVRDQPGLHVDPDRKPVLVLPVLTKMRDDLHITEAKSQNELAKTSVTPATAKFLSIAFLVLITFPAALQIAAQVRTGTVLKEFRALAGGPSRENLRAFEQELDNAAILRYYWQPRIQELLLTHRRLREREGGAVRQWLPLLCAWRAVCVWGAISG